MPSVGTLEVVRERGPATARGFALAHLGRQLGQLQPESTPLRVIIREPVGDGVQQPKAVHAKEPATRPAGNPSRQGRPACRGGEVMIERFGQRLHVVLGLVFEVVGCAAVQVLAGGSRQAAQRSIPDQVVREPDPAIGSGEECGSLEFSDRRGQSVLAPAEEPA